LTRVSLRSGARVRTRARALIAWMPKDRVIARGVRMLVLLFIPDRVRGCWSDDKKRPQDRVLWPYIAPARASQIEASAIAPAPGTTSRHRHCIAADEMATGAAALVAVDRMPRGSLSGRAGRRARR
jgi:hypothetical protein